MHVIMRHHCLHMIKASQVLPLQIFRTIDRVCENKRERGEPARGQGVTTLLNRVCTETK